MTDSRSPHGALTEDVRENVSGKGREGNKEGKGNRVETSPSILAFRTRRPATSPSAGTARLGWMGEA